MYSRFLEELSKRYKKQSEDMMKLLNNTVARLNNATLEAEIKVRPEFFYFSFYRPSRPNFLEIEKNNKRDFFQFYFFISFRLMPVQYWSSVMFFRFDFNSIGKWSE